MNLIVKGEGKCPLQEPVPEHDSTPLTYEQIRQVTISELKPHNGPITLVDYDSAWPEQFARDVQRIRAALGQRALQVEHIRSTPVPGLIAKPIINILLGSTRQV